MTVPDFSDFGHGDEIPKYLEVTGLVAKTSEMDRGITAQETLDGSLEIESSVKSEVDAEKDQQTVDTGAPIIGIEQLSQQGAAIVERWEHLRNKRMVSYWFSKVRNIEDDVIYLSRWTEKIEKAAYYAGERGDVDIQTKAETILEQIYGFSPGRVADDIKESSRYLLVIGLFLTFMVVFIVMPIMPRTVVESFGRLLGLF